MLFYEECVSLTISYCLDFLCISKVSSMLLYGQWGEFIAGLFTAGCEEKWVKRAKKPAADETFFTIENIQTYPEPCITPAHSVFSKPWHIQNQKHMQNPGIFRAEVCWEPLDTRNPVKHLWWRIEQKLLTDSCFRKLWLFLLYQLFTFSTF